MLVLGKVWLSMKLRWKFIKLCKIFNICLRKQIFSNIKIISYYNIRSIWMCFYNFESPPIMTTGFEEVELRGRAKSAQWDSLTLRCFVLNVVTAGSQWWVLAGRRRRMSVVQLRLLRLLQSYSDPATGHCQADSVKREERERVRVMESWRQVRSEEWGVSRLAGVGWVASPSGCRLLLHTSSSPGPAREKVWPSLAGVMDYLVWCLCLAGEVLKGNISQQWTQHIQRK